MCTRTHRSRFRAFTLTELLTVLGLISLLVSLFVPVAAKVRAAGNSASCMARLRQMGVAWTAYVVENHGRLPEHVWYTPTPTPEAAWESYWPGLLAKRGVVDEALLCPAAADPVETSGNWGFGNVSRAWSGRFAFNSAIRMSDTHYRVSSYGYNGNLTAGGGFGGASCLLAVNNPSNVPAFLDCAYADVQPLNRPSAALLPPPNLRGDKIVAGRTDQEHWKFLLGRHGRGINVCMADGSARWVRLDDTYRLTWNGQWVPSGLQLPSN
jgi:prepilin-type processing-associated H-X9-DG protein